MFIFIRQFRTERRKRKKPTTNDFSYKNDHILRVQCTAYLRMSTLLFVMLLLLPRIPTTDVVGVVSLELVRVKDWLVVVVILWQIYLVRESTTGRSCDAVRIPL